MILSNTVAFTTGALPSGVPAFTATGTASGSGLTLLALPLLDFATIVNSAGAPVWYYQIPNNVALQADFQQQVDGSFTVSVPAEATHTIPLAGMSGVYTQVDVLGNFIRTWRPSARTEWAR